MSLPTLPLFTGDATLWFAQIEAYFSAHGISPTQQLQLLYCGMAAPLATSARDLVTDPSPDATYASVKAEIQCCNTRSVESHFSELMADEELGDRTLSQFLRRLSESSGDPTDAPLLQQIFFSRLPSDIQMILAMALEYNTVDQIATMVDKILEFSRQPSSHGACVCSKAPLAASFNSSSLSHDAISDKLDVLTQWMDSLCQDNTCFSRSCSRSRSAPRASRSHSRLCWYHSNFADKVHKCIQPCSLKPSGN
ncbi:uncharacterized protein LOC106878010 [Octopus bimaculoides]|uniref:uncharacterized protein LOC106878010 n=1 Tax=Octopus bimaculoides TaxID=37653 RepID=UPI00071DBC8F|nr:uncharacterized protein LOC106878010 [Octopus bimaculoides]|eukprot:XP_014782578.1 PREDICTED: uncharacterized protein LOC106878010 [Octopus bimaculoides]